MRIAWLSYLDPWTFSGGGELHNRGLIEVGRARGHQIQVSSWLKGRPQRALRRLGAPLTMPIDWSADLFVLANIHNHGPRRDLFPEAIVERALETGRAVIVSDAWVDVCTLDLPCGGDRSSCPAECSRAWANRLYGRAAGAIFVSPMQERMIRSGLDVPLPPHVMFSRPHVDTTLFRPLGLERDIDVLYVGSINLAKGYEDLISRFGKRLTLVGPNYLGKRPEARWLGPIPHHELPAIYNRAKTFAHLPRWQEPMGRAVVEAGLCGCELVLNDRVGVATYPDADWRDPERVRTNAGRLWEDLERASTDI